MLPYGIKGKTLHKCKGHGSRCAICCPMTFKQARKRGLQDYSVARVSRARVTLETRREIAEQMDL